MVLAKRERYIAIGLGAAIALLVLDRFALTPLLEAARAAESQRSQLAAQHADAQTLISQSRRLSGTWNDIVRKGLKGDPAEAESQLLQALQSWAGEAGAKLSLLKPDRLPADKRPLQEINCQASGTGTMRSVAQLLWRVQSANFPVKVKELQINSRKEGTDDLTFVLHLSTVYAPGGAMPATAAASRPVSGGR